MAAISPTFSKVIRRGAGIFWFSGAACVLLLFLLSCRQQKKSFFGPYGVFQNVRMPGNTGSVGALSGLVAAARDGIWQFLVLSWQVLVAPERLFLLLPHSHHRNCTLTSLSLSFDSTLLFHFFNLPHFYQHTLT